MSDLVCTVTLSQDVVLVLSDILCRASGDGAIRPADSAEQHALMDLTDAVFRALPSPALDHPEQVDAARARLARPTSGTAAPTPLVVYVDVDDTLVRSFGSKRIPIQSMIDRVIELHSIGVELFCWSSGGGDYAHRSAIELGIAGCFLSFLPKPMLLVDDQAVSDWRGLRYLHPNEAGSLPLLELASAHGTAPG